MTTQIPTMPYFEVVLAALAAKDATVERAWGRNLHFGYWLTPERPDLSIDGYVAAMDAMTRQHFEHAEISPGQKIADVGCGLGGTIASLNESFDGLDLVGVNIDDRQLQVARASVAPRWGSGNQIAFVQSDACQLPFEDHSLDVVFSVECIFHFESRARYFREARRVLKPGGRLVVSEFVARGLTLPLLGALYLPFHRAVRATYGVSAPPVTRSTYNKLATDNGFDLLKINDVTRHTLPDYDMLPRLMTELKQPATFRRGVKFLEYATRLGFYTYDVLSFRARARD